ncbi:hypothetical protein BC628DRAFT_274358 [Trametes gibbosa]|nr:hypothetical protein BC628DRAFT_274358 [Trametes gibbosa]
MLTMNPHASHDRTLLSKAIITNFAFPVSAPGALYPLEKRPDPMHPSPVVAEPPTPTSTVALRRPHATSASEDDILPMPSISRTPQRSSSRTYRWVEDQQHLSGAAEHPPHLDAGVASTRAHPYLAYPHLSAASLAKDNKGTIRTIESYVFVDDDVAAQLEPTERVPRGRDASVAQSPSAGPRADTPSPAPAPVPAPATTPRKSFRSSQAIFPSSSPLRSLHLTFSSRRPSAPATSAPRSHSPASSISTFRRTPAPAGLHSRDSSLVTVNAIHQRSARTDSPELSASPPKTTAWKFKRPSVAGHFSPAPSDENESAHPPPRKSTSSSATQSGSSTVYTRTSSDVPHKMHFGSIRSHSSATIFSTSPSLWSLPTDASHINDPPESEHVLARDRLQSSSESSVVAWKPSSSPVPHFGSVSSLLASPRSRNRRKRKLIVSGIPPDDERRFQGVRKWCESFGELSSINRAPNGDLHVDFRKAEVADTVCRLNARVYIAGVGSVCLSWFTGKRP